MRAVISVLCFIVVVFLNPSESMLGFIKKKYQMPSTMLVKPPKLSARSYFRGNPEELVLRSIDLGFVHVGIQEENGVEYVIGYIENVRNRNCPLFPFVHATPGHGYQRIKIRVDGDYAYKYIILPEKDALDDVFFKPYNPRLIRVFDIDFKNLRKPLEPAIPVQATKLSAPFQASASQTKLPQSSTRRPTEKVPYIPSFAARKNQASTPGGQVERRTRSPQRFVSPSLI